jgi:hypothetical protein
MGAKMRGSDERNDALFSYVDLEDRVPARHPQRLIREIVTAAPARLDGAFDSSTPRTAGPLLRQSGCCERLIQERQVHDGSRRLIGLQARAVSMKAEYRIGCCQQGISCTTAA